MRACPAHIRRHASQVRREIRPQSRKESHPAAALAARPLKKGDHVFLVDGSGYIFRAYHALPPLNRKSDGLQVNAVLGFCNMLWKLLRDMKPEERPTHLAVVFDKSEKTFRTEIYPEYKANRDSPPDDLIPQFPLIREAVHAFEIPCLEQAGYEADDLIATYARLACEAKATTTIVSSDKDLMQLVGPTVVMYDTMKDKRIGRDEVIEKFGVPPEKVIEVQSLIGDTSDNVPGVPGIGVKTAAQLIGEYGDLETLLKRAGEIKQDKRRQTLIDNAEQARISKRLVTLDQHVDLDTPIDDLLVHEPDYKNLIAFLKAMEFSTLTRRVAEAAEIDAAQIEPSAKLSSGKALPAPQEQGDTAAPAKPQKGAVTPRFRCHGGRGADPSDVVSTPVSLAAVRAQKIRALPVDRAKYEVVRDLARLKAWMARAIEEGVLAISTETTSIDPMQATLCGFSLAVAPNEACYVPLAHRQRGSRRRLVRCRPRARADSRKRSDRRDQAGAGRSRHSQDRAQSEIQLADIRAARHPHRAARRYLAAILCARCRPLRSTMSPRWPCAISITRPSISTRSPAPASRASPSTMSRSRRPPNIPRKMPTSRCGCGRRSSPASPPTA